VDLPLTPVTSLTALVFAVAAGGAVGAVGGAFGPRVVAALPEPADPDDAEDKVSYRRLAEVRGLAVAMATAAACVCGLLAWALGWSPALPMWLYLGVAGVVLAYVDWRTRLLPTRLIAPSYAVVVASAVLASALSGDWAALGRAGLGWLVAGGLFFALWFVYPKGMGYGDVRLSGVLGIALGWLGWAELVVGVYAGFLLGAVGGGLLALLRVVDRRRYPFGPFMLVGAVVGVLAGPPFGAWYLQ
jgi:leader peptidase (prepilin peptidase) / N-methyltransferase